MDSLECVSRLIDDFEIGYDDFKNKKDIKNCLEMLKCIKQDVEAFKIIKKSLKLQLFNYEGITYLDVRGHDSGLCVPIRFYQAVTDKKEIDVLTKTLKKI